MLLLLPSPQHKRNITAQHTTPHRDNSGELDAEELRYLIYDRLHLTHITEKEFTTLMHDFGSFETAYNWDAHMCVCIRTLAVDATDKDQNSTISMDEFTEAMRTFIMIEV